MMKYARYDHDIFNEAMFNLAEIQSQAENIERELTLVEIGWGDELLNGEMSTKLLTIRKDLIAILGLRLAIQDWHTEMWRRDTMLKEGIRDEKANNKRGV